MIENLARARDAAVAGGDDLVEYAKSAICDVGRRIWERRLCAGTDGNLSVRVGDRVLCTPSGVSKGFLSPHMIRTVDLTGAALDAEEGFAVTSEIKVHLAVYRERRDVRAVVHSHAPHANAFALAGVAPPEGIYPEAEIVLGRVPLVPYALAGTAALAQNVARASTRHTTAMLLAHHGSLTLSSRDLLDAYHRLEVLDAYCEMLLDMARLGRFEVLRDDQFAEVLASKRGVLGGGDDRASAGGSGVDRRNAAAFAALGARVAATLRAPEIGAAPQA